MRAALTFVLCVGPALFANLMSVESACAQNTNYPGYLGVFVQEANGGMQITGFIRRTPAAALANQGEISSRDVITKLAGKPTRTLNELKAARNSIPEGKEAKMVLRSGGQSYHVWIARNEAAAAAAAAPDQFYRGGAGEGDDEDIRDARGRGDNSGDGEGDLRDKK